MQLVLQLCWRPASMPSWFKRSKGSNPLGNGAINQVAAVVVAKEIGMAITKAMGKATTKEKEREKEKEEESGKVRK